MAQVHDLLTQAPTISPLFAAFGVVGIWVLFQLYSYLRDPLRDIPGPFMARFSRLWLLRKIAGCQFEKTNIALHKKYGPIVRLAPHYYSIDDIDAIPIIYGHGTRFVKGNWYSAAMPPEDGASYLFTETNIDVHAAVRRRVSSLYSMTSLVAMEPQVMECARSLVKQFNSFAEKRAAVNLQVWLQYFAFDAVALITLNKSFGFLDTGKDNGDMIAALDAFQRYFSSVGVIHEWHSTFSQIMSLLPNQGIAYLHSFMANQIAEVQRTKSKRSLEKDQSLPTDDFLTKLLRINAQDPEKFPLADILAIALTNIAAGSDTTSISLAGILYYVMKSPSSFNKLRDEIDEASKGRGSDEMITFQEAQKLPYLQACIKEGLRLHPATGLPLVRVVPQGGATIAGRYFPAKTEVGVNSWVAHANERIFGPDADVFQPERWLQSPEQLSDMNRYSMAFGSGSRTCIGKNISLLEISVLIPELIRKFTFSLVHPERLLQTKNVFFVKQTDLECFVSRRK